MSSGAPRASGRASASEHREERPRVSARHTDSFKSERSESSKGPSPHPGSFPGVHKRTASGNPRPTSRNVEERRYEERRVTERTYEAHLERVVPRATSPDRATRRRGPSESRSASEAPRHKAPEARQRDSRAETPQGMTTRWTFDSIKADHA